MAKVSVKEVQTPLRAQYKSSPEAALMSCAARKESSFDFPLRRRRLRVARLGYTFRC